MGQIATLHVTGFEHGLLSVGQNPDKIFLASGGTFAIGTSYGRWTGGYGLRCVPASGTATYLYAPTEGPPGQTESVGRFYVYFATFPSANHGLFYIREYAGGRFPVGFEFNASTNKIRCHARDEAGNTDYTSSDSGVSLSTGKWYRVEFKITRPTSTTRKFELRIAEGDGTATAETDYTTSSGVATSYWGT